MLRLRLKNWETAEMSKIESKWKDDSDWQGLRNVLYSAWLFSIKKIHVTDVV